MAIVLGLVVGAVWFGLGRLDHQVDWVSVMAPTNARVGEPLVLRVQVQRLTAPTYLCVDLHWTTNHHTTQGFLATSPPQWITTPGQALEFELSVPARPGLRFVNGIIFLSPTGTWSDHSMVANTDLIPVTEAMPAREFRPISLFSSSITNGYSVAPTAAWPRILLGLLWFAAAVMAWVSRSRNSSSASPAQNAYRWNRLVLALAAIALWELAGWETWIGIRVRAFTRTADLYHLRHWLQRGVISLIVGAMLIRSVGWWRQRRAMPLPQFALELYLALIITDLFSLHALDQFLRFSWRGLLVIHILKLGLVAVILISLTRRSQRRDCDSGKERSAVRESQ